MEKEFKDLILGDVIWAHDTVGNHQHIYILCTEPKSDSVDCIMAVNITSNCRECCEQCVDIDGERIPPDWFNVVKPKSFIRLEQPSCINKDNYKKTHYTFKGNLQQFPDLFDQICLKCPQILSKVCSCNCD
jgi:hypothetical protein